MNYSVLNYEENSNFFSESSGCHLIVCMYLYLHVHKDIQMCQYRLSSIIRKTFEFKLSSLAKSSSSHFSVLHYTL